MELLTAGRREKAGAAENHNDRDLIPKKEQIEAENCSRKPTGVNPSRGSHKDLRPTKNLTRETWWRNSEKRKRPCEIEEEIHRRGSALITSSK